MTGLFAVSLAAAAPPYVPAGLPALGTAAPIEVLTASARWDWVAACQARVDTDGDGTLSAVPGFELGDVLSAYLLTARAPEGIGIDWYLGEAPGRPWVAAVRDRQVVVVDVGTGTAWPLVDAEDGEGPDDLVDRFAGFSSADDAILLRGPRGQSRIVARDLVRGEERTVVDGAALGEGTFAVQRVEVVGGAWVDADLDPPGRLGETRTARCLHTCAGCNEPLPGAPELASEGAVPVWLGNEHRLLRLSDGRREPREVLAAAPNALVVDAPDGSIRWVPAAGEEVEIAPPSCGGTLLAVSADNAHFLVRCDDADPATPNVFVFDRTGPALPTGLTQERGLATVASGRAYLVPGRPRWRLLDLASATVRRGVGMGLLGQWGDAVLRWRGGALLRYDLGTGRARRITRIRGSATVATYGRHLAFQDTERTQIVDLAAGVVRGETVALPALVRDDGTALVPHAVRDGMAWGPLEWMRPE